MATAVKELYADSDDSLYDDSNYDDVSQARRRSQGSDHTQATSVWSLLKDGDLDLSGKRLRVLEKPLDNDLLQKVKKLTLDFNEITIWPEVILNMPALKHLSVFGQICRGKASNDHKPSLVNLPQTHMGMVSDTKRLRSLNLGNNAIETIPDTPKIGVQLSKLTILDLRLNKIKTFPQIIFQMVELEQLILSANFIRILPRQIDKLSKLSVLNLANNLLTELPDSLCNLTQIKTLSLKNNKLEHLPLKLYKLGRVLNYKRENGRGQGSSCEGDDDTEWGLSLQGNILITPPQRKCQNGVAAMFDYLKKLDEEPEQEVNLEDIKDLAHIESCLENNPYVSKLKLQGNGLESLPRNISQCTFLHSLYLDDNMIIGFSDHIKISTRLKMVSLQNQNGNLKEIPHVLTSPESVLCALYLSQNKITRIPQTIENLDQLRVLELEKNKITVLPDALFRLFNLEYLSLADNCLERLPSEISKLTNLQVLRLSNNQLAFLPDSICQVTLLSCLSVRKNRLRYLPLNFDSLVNLKSQGEYVTEYKRFKYELRLDSNHFENPSHCERMKNANEVFDFISMERRKDPIQYERRINKLKAEVMTQDELYPSLTRELANIANNIGREYRQLGIQLGMSSAKIDQLHSENPHAFDLRSKMLECWLKQESKVGYSEPECEAHICKALEDVGRRDVAEKFFSKM